MSLNNRVQTDTYALFQFYPLHINVGSVAIPAENLQINQSFNCNYNPVEAYGRMDPIVTYKNTTRSLNINFSCQSHQMFDGPDGPLHNIARVNRLTQYLYPSYHDLSGHGTEQLAILKAPPFFRITYGNYIGSYDSLGEVGGELIRGLTGYITNFQHQLGSIPRNVAHGRYFARGKDGKNWPEPIRALPREVKISFTFSVVHDKSVGWTEHEGKDAFSRDGYGENFPYNVGNFEMSKNARDLQPLVQASNKAIDKEQALMDELRTGVANGMSDKDKTDIANQLIKAEGETNKATKALKDKMGPLNEVNAAQANAALKLASK